MQMQITMHVSEVNAAIALFSGAAEKIRDQAMAQSMPPQPMVPQPPVDTPKVDIVDENSGLTD